MESLVWKFYITNCYNNKKNVCFMCKCENSASIKLYFMYVYHYTIQYYHAKLYTIEFQSFFLFCSAYRRVKITHDRVGRSYSVILRNALTIQSKALRSIILSSLLGNGSFFQSVLRYKYYQVAGLLLPKADS